MATPSLAMIPSAYADSKVYSVLPNNGDGDFTFNRDSSATRVGQNGLIQTVGYFGNDLVTNGDFATDTDWIKNNGITISGGSVNFTGLAGQYVNQDISFVSGKVYKINFNVLSGSGTLTVFFGAGNNVSPGSFTIGENEIIATGGGSDTKIYFGSLFTGSITNISVVEIQGDQPRLNYDISNGVVQSCPSLLLEGASTNLVTYSNNFLDSSWDVFRGSITSDVIISPDGTQNASRYQEDSQTGSHLFRRQNLSITNGLSYTGSIFIKKGELTSIILQSNSSSRWVASATFDVANGVVTSGTGVIENYGNGWYRCSISGNAVQTTTAAGLEVYTSVGVGTNGSGLYMYNAMFEQQSYATSLIPTNGASQTRAAETCNDAGTAATFNDSEGVLYAEISAFDISGDYRLISLSDGTQNNRIFLGFRFNTGYIYYYVIAGGATQSFFDTTITSVNSFSKIALKYKANDFALWINGVEIYADSSGSVVSGLDTLQFADGNGTQRNFYGNCKDLRVYNEALTDAQLQTLTTL